MEKAMPVDGGDSCCIVITVVDGVILILMLLLIIILILIACKFKPWRRFLSSSAAARFRHPFSIKVDDIERPLISEDYDVDESQICESTSYSIEGGGRGTKTGFVPPHSNRVTHKQRLLPTSPQLTHSDSFVLDISNISEDSFVGQTLKPPLAASKLAEERIYEKEDVKYSPKCADANISSELIPKYTANKRSILMLEVISGPSRGLLYSIQSTNTSNLPVTVGRVSPGDILLKDSEVSGKHAMINWNVNNLNWELVDIGSLNGTLLNSQAVHHTQSGSRHWGNPVELSSGDIITFGTTSKILVQITAQTENQIPFGIGIASDPMAMRRGGKKLPMEDVCYYQWPLPGTDQFGFFGICDGHGGADAATSVSKVMPEVIASILSDSFRREKVLSECDASDVLREAFSQTEASINHYYEGCTATVLLVWADGHEKFFAQCANVGDSACVVNIEGKLIKMTEDHRLVSYSERLRFQEMGEPLKDGESRICGINLARMLGDKFLKQQDARFSSEPYISEVVFINQESRGFALLASDGFWDVVNFKKAVQLVQQTMERNVMDQENSAEKMANILLSEARSLRTKDNTSIIFLDFNVIDRINSCKLDP
ncbi:phosphatase 2C 70 [Olea europaea subsp. europaea]|uniref:protein-serine/threonine phosphatase n=1 Tax=Olea europaea subsp. europaea TaxID=158383 RepID=A0A8S0P745_OLEEU|nr:phosphatase 2C 70 [Olea europaea subsp. europaea]